MVTKIVTYLQENDLNVLGLDYSPIKGPEGNREYLVFFTKDKNLSSDFTNERIDNVVDESHSQL